MSGGFALPRMPSQVVTSPEEYAQYSQGAMPDQSAQQAAQNAYLAQRGGGFAGGIMGGLAPSPMPYTNNTMGLWGATPGLGMGFTGGLAAMPKLDPDKYPPGSFGGPFSYQDPWAPSQ